MIISDSAPPPPTIFDYLRDPASMTPDALEFFTVHYYKMSTAMLDKPNSPHHRYYYCFALECERRGWNLDSIVNR